MTMIKIVLFVVAVFVLLFLLRGAFGRSTPRREASPDGKAGKGAGGAAPLLACAQCGMHLPAGEALPGRGGVFCGEAHRAEYERRQGVDR